MEKKILGTTILELLPSKENARNSEGSFIRLKSGRIVFAYSSFQGESNHDNARSNISIIYSDDDGLTFSTPKTVLTADECGADNLMSVSLLEMKDGSVGVFYMEKTQTDTDFPKAKVYLRKTFDFISFSEKTLCTKNDIYHVLNNDRVIRLKNGNILFNVAEYYYENVKQGYKNSRVAFYLSTDDGNSFTRTCEVFMPFADFDTGLQEPGVIELDDGRIFAWYRSNVGRILKSYSYDGGYTFTTPEPTLLISPVSPTSIKPLSSGEKIIIYNPFDCGGYYGYDQRSPLVIRMADGNMNFIWDDFLMKWVEDLSVDRGYCYTAIFETDDAVLLAYSAGSKEEGGRLSRLKIKRIEKNELN